MILCGLFCAGKTTLGQAVATHTNLPFYDTDHLLEAAHGKSVSELWHAVGQKTFRNLETEVVLSLNKEPSIIATGGGTLLREENRSHLKQLSTLIYLKASIPVLWERLQKRGLPAYLDPIDPLAHIHKLASERFPLFEAHCNHVIETEGKNFSQLIQIILENLK